MFKKYLLHRFIIFGCFFTLFVSCGTNYLTNEINQDILSFKKAFNKQVNQSNRILQEILASWELVENAKNISKQDQYQLANKNINRLKKIILNDLETELKKFNTKSTEKLQFIREKQRFKKEDPRYRSYLELKDYAIKSSKIFKRKNESIKSYLNKINKYFRSIGLYRLNPKRLTKEVNKNLKIMKHQIDQVRSKLEALKDNVTRDKNQDRKNQRKKVITKLNYLLNKMETAKLEFQPLLDRFRNETKNKDEYILVIPESASHIILGELKALIRNIRDLGEQFQSRTKELKALK